MSGAAGVAAGFVVMATIIVPVAVRFKVPLVDASVLVSPS